MGSTYLVECYTPGVRGKDVETAGARVLAATADLRRQGLAIEYVGALFVPVDEIVFHVFSSESAEAVREASTRAKVGFERVVESIAMGSLRLRRDERDG